MEKTEKAKMLAGDLYNANDPELVAERARAQGLMAELRASRTAESDMALLRRLLGGLGENGVIRPLFACDYGSNIRIGRNAFINYNCVFLDCATIEIGDDLQMASMVQLYTPEHPLDPAVRRSGLEYARPIRIGNNVWIGGGAIVLSGVTIGDDCVIGAGSVVTRDLPAGSVAVGNPAKVIRSLAG